MTYAAGVACALALSACTGGGSSPGPTALTPPPSTSAGAPSPTGSAAPSAPSSSTPITSASGPNFPKGVPAAAQKHTQDGAKAFAAHLIEQINVAWTTPDAGLIPPLCDLNTSPSCRFFAETAKSLEAKGNRYEGNPVTPVKFTSLTGGSGPQQVLLSLIQERRNVINKAGEVVLTDARKESRVVIFLDWTNSGWLANDIKATEK